MGTAFGGGIAVCGGVVGCVVAWNILVHAIIILASAALPLAGLT
jgi:hypothetical protein